MKTIFGALATSALLPHFAFAGLINDSHIDVEARTFYFNNQNRNSSSLQSNTQQLGQGFVINGQSGFTEGPVGFGADAIGLWGAKLYGPEGKNGSLGSFPVRRTSGAPSTFGSLRLAAKARLGKTVIRDGFQRLELPVIKSNNGRMLPSLYRGITLHSADIKTLTLDAGYIDRYQGRNSDHFQQLKATGNATGFSSGFYYAGGRYTPTQAVQFSYFHARLNDFYQQHFLGAVNRIDAGKGSFTTDIRYFISHNDGQKFGGNVDNNTLGGLISYTLASNTWGVGYQTMTGSSGFPYLDPGQNVDSISTEVTGGNTGLITDAPLSKFKTAHEQTWVLRYSSQLDNIGLTGVTFDAAYLSGHHAKTSAAAASQNEWVRTFGLSYKIPSHIIKGMTVAWKNVAYRSNITSTHSQDQNILMLTYKFRLL